jgi:hypothetical protein
MSNGVFVMATDYHNQTRSPAPDYRTRSGGSNGWLIGLAVAIVLAMIAFFSFSGSERPALTVGTTGEQVTLPPVTHNPPAAQEQVVPPASPATTAPAQ